MVYALRRPILWASQQPQIKSALSSTPLTRSVVSRFVAGETVAEAVDVVRRLRSDGIYSTVDYLGEDVVSRAQVSDNVDSYVIALNALAEADLAEGCEVTLKLSALGQSLEQGDELALRAATNILRVAQEHGVQLSVDMEDHRTTDRTIDTVLKLREIEPSVGIALQSMLRRTEADLATLAVQGSRVRLVKGAYDEPDDVAYDGGKDVDRAYARGLGTLFASAAYPMVGSHDPALIELAKKLADEHGRSRDSFEFQMLLGIRRDEQKRLAAQGYRMRAYVPFGVDWYGYFTRRLAERPANLTFFLRSLVNR